MAVLLDRFVDRMGMAMKRSFVLLLVAAALLALGRPVSSRAAEPRPKVLVDRSHEWLFAYDDLGDRMLRPAGYEVVLCDASLGEKMKLDDFDIVMVQQAHCKFPFSSAEVRLLTEYVRDQVSIEETLWLFSLAAEKDLTKLYQNLGITYRFSPPLSAEEVETRLAAYRQEK